MKSNIILAGVGGQGILTIAGVLSAAALESGLHVKQAEVHGMSQRGGDVQSNLRLSSDPIHSDLIPLGEADLIVSMEPMEALRYLPYLRPGGAIVTNNVPFENIENYPAPEQLDEAYRALDNISVVRIDTDSMARSAGSARSGNIVLLGAASVFVDIDSAALEVAIIARFAAKGDAVVKANVEAFRMGAEASENVLIK